VGRVVLLVDDAGASWRWGQAVGRCQPPHWQPLRSWV